jgi:hypothetical protein
MLCQRNRWNAITYQRGTSTRWSNIEKTRLVLWFCLALHFCFKHLQYTYHSRNHTIQIHFYHALNSNLIKQVKMVINGSHSMWHQNPGPKIVPQKEKETLDLCLIAFHKSIFQLRLKRHLRTLMKGIYRTRVLDYHTTGLLISQNCPIGKTSWFTGNEHILLHLFRCILLHLLNRSAKPNRVLFCNSLMTTVRKKILKTMQFVAPFVYNNADHIKDKI